MSIEAIGGTGWRFLLNYLSGYPIDGTLGGAFNYPQNIYLVEYSNGDVRLFKAQDITILFVSNGDGTYSSEDNVSMAELVKVGSGVNEQYILRSSSGHITTFYGTDSAIATPGRVQRIEDRYGNASEFVWGSASGLARIQSVTDAYGRVVTYSYYGSALGYQIREIEDFLGRKLNFQYDTDGRLVAVVTPSILKAAEGNEFPGGTAYVFQYDTQNPRSERRNDLIRIWYPNEATPFIDAETRTVDVQAVYDDAVPRYFVQYGQDPTDADTYGKVVRETVGDPNGGPGGTSRFEYISDPEELAESIFYDPENPQTEDEIVSRTIMFDRNDNETIYDFNPEGMAVRVEVVANRDKSSLQGPSYVTWTRYNDHNQPILVIQPEGNSTEYQYSDGVVDGFAEPYARRIGLLERETRKPGNDYGIPSRPGSNGQEELTRTYFYDPLFNQTCAMIEERGNPIASGSVYFTPQNLGDTPTDADRSRYATISFFDYQKNIAATVTGNTNLQEQLDLTATEIQDLIDHVNAQMIAGGLPDGFQLDLGDINGDGTGDGDSSGLPAANILGNPVKVKHPSVRLVGGDEQVRVELFTNNDRGQVTTRTNPEGNLTVYVRYPLNDPEGDGNFVSDTLSTKQYGRLKATHVDANPDEVMTLVGEDGDLVDFIPGKITRTNTPGIYLDLVTRHESGGSGSGCTSCSYDALGNVLSTTDPRGFTTRFDRNEMGMVYRTTGPSPYLYRQETYYDANGNVIRQDTEDIVIDFQSDDPTDALYAHFVPSGNTSGGAATAAFKTKAGEGGKIRPGWFVNRHAFDLLDNMIENDMDATGSYPERLVTTYRYDPNQNLIETIKPEGNTVEIDYDERNIQIAQRVGDGDEAAVTVMSYDRNGNLVNVISPADRDGSPDNNLSCTIQDAFRSSQPLTHSGDWMTENLYDGFDRTIEVIDAVGGLVENMHDPTSRPIQATRYGTIGGPSPTNRTGSGNVKLAESLTRFDEAGRAYERQQNVFLADGATLPSGRAVTHTGGGLAINSTANDHTGTVTLTSDGESYVLMRTVYDRTGRTLQQVQDNTAVTALTYDGANRALTTTDALGNVTTSAYDANGNLIGTTRTEICTITTPSVEDEEFASIARYDGMNRPIVSAMQGADGSIQANYDLDVPTMFTLICYDSRGNQTLTVDPKGNTSVSIYDGASRAIETRQHMRQQGEGQNPPDANRTFNTTDESGGAIGVQTVYDANSRNIALIDDHGNTTAYEYDSLDRQVQMMFPDGSKRIMAYDTASDLIDYTDENGSVMTYGYDAMGRRISCAISRAPGVAGTTAQAWEYDGVSRRTFSRDSVDSEDADVEAVFDSLNRTLEDSQAYDGRTRNVTYDVFTSYMDTGFAFPNGRQTANVFDALYRRTSVADATSPGSPIAAWQFFGRSRVAEVILANGLACTMMNNDRTHSAVQADVALPAWGTASSDRLGYDGAGRMIAKRFIPAAVDGGGAYVDTTPVVAWTTAFDKATNKFFERELHAENRSHLYQPITGETALAGYDSVSRLLQYQRGTLASGGTHVVSPITLPGTDTIRDYQLDHLGNWKRTTFTAVGDSEVTQRRQHNPLNQIMSIKTGSDPKVDFSYDLNGNLLDDGIRLYAFDAFNRLIEIKRASDDAVIGTYVYDAGTRRIRKTVTNGGLSGTLVNATTDYIYNPNWQCVEEHNPYPALTPGSSSSSSSSGGEPDDQVLRQYVWGIYIDELIQQREDPESASGGAQDYYAGQDLLYRNTALTDDTGGIVEVYDTDTYGNTQIYSAAGTGGDWWADDALTTKSPICDYIFTGRQYDSESDTYQYRYRQYTFDWGRFIQRDPVDYSDGMSVFQYVRSRPAYYVDPRGSLSWGGPQIPVLGDGPLGSFEFQCESARSCGLQCQDREDPANPDHGCYMACMHWNVDNCSDNYGPFNCEIGCFESCNNNVENVINLSCNNECMQWKSQHCPDPDPNHGYSINLDFVENIFNNCTGNRDCCSVSACILCVNLQTAVAGALCASMALLPGLGTAAGIACGLAVGTAASTARYFCAGCPNP